MARKLANGGASRQRQFDRLRVGLAQMRSTDAHSGNIAALRQLCRNAAEEECDLLALPEVAGLMNRRIRPSDGVVTEAESDPFMSAARKAAAEFGIWIHIGSTPVRDGDKFLNHSALIDRQGNIRAEYDKIHLFDLYPDGGKPIRESSRYRAGTRPVAVSTPWGTWGMTICYDLRFPHMFRRYAQTGATVIFVPSAFTVPTGRAHWKPLLRARAIENGCWIIAAAQVGRHADGRQTYGHSLIVSPWGRIACDLGGAATGFAPLTLDLREVEGARRQIPSLEQD